MPSPMGSRKPKRPPPVTPRRFNRFFTPRNTRSSTNKAVSDSARQLRDITRAAVNKSEESTSSKATPKKTVKFGDLLHGDAENVQLETPVLSSRKRKAYLSPESSPVHSSPLKRPRYIRPSPFPIHEDAIELDEPPHHPAPILRLGSSGQATRILQRSFGGVSGIGRGFLRDNGTTGYHYTANFYTDPDGLYNLPARSPPFCAAGCNTNSLVAVGDEDGWIHILDTDEDADFTKPHLSFAAHTNAIMDIAFSSDDRYIATGSGDQTGQIIDARTQQTMRVLAKHKSSVKQIRFQPSDENIIATSSRDGCVQIWDLRCKGGNNSMHSAWGPDAPYASVIRSLSSAHSDSNPTPVTSTSKPESNLTRRSEPSITSLSFLPDGRDHLLLTASDASTCIKLWDIRGRYSLRGPAVPISTTRHPDAHTKHRHFAINSLTLSTDASRLYALSKDNTIYAYSTSHLILGVATELHPFSSTSSQKPCSTTGNEGLGPLYGFRHTNFHAGSFYVKASLRRARGDQSEILAVGSTDGSPVLFPTDENLLRREAERERERRGRGSSSVDTDDDENADAENDLPHLPPPRRSLRSTTSTTLLTRTSKPSTTTSSTLRSLRSPGALLHDTIPIYEHGTPLIRGHDAEVTAVAWTRNGNLVSVSDDYKVRRWNEGAKAGELRMGGEGEGKRWGCGWAAVRRGWDGDE
ncbi:WD40 repeat-like protein [Sporormia fimetaria CBS 119925]|uniref:WD40 repeat-like protein n=1 Tax=Sporormia fimetaria CBS 119925 TaxID=1340428 RepID=A0A6A6V6K7_9PLEO|nr:WD40 repeat-like protein [Sporormia fimetaria CBS 119925]